jgi:hypothetical protein
MPISFHKLDLIVFISLMVGGLTPSEEFRVWIFCGIGGILSGFVGSELFTAGPTDYRRRWATNALIAFLFAPFATIYAQALIKAKLPAIEVPLPFIAIATSASLGIAGVSFITWAVPFLKRKYGKSNNEKRNLRGEGS